jgi:hypothetical protein
METQDRIRILRYAVTNTEKQELFDAGIIRATPGDIRYSRNYGRVGGSVESGRHASATYNQTISAQLSSARKYFIILCEAPKFMRPNQSFKSIESIAKDVRSILISSYYKIMHITITMQGKKKIAMMQNGSSFSGTCCTCTRPPLPPTVPNPPSYNDDHCGGNGPGLARYKR